MKHLAALFLLLTTCCAYSQSWKWSLRAGGNSDPSGNSYQWPEGIQDMVTDSRGNVYTVSHLISAGPGDATIRNTPLTTYNSGNSKAEILVASFNCAGALRWKKVIGSIIDAQYTSLAVDTLGNVYLAGGLSYVLTSWTPLRPRARFDSDTLLPYDYNKTFFIVKYDSSGTFKWLAMPDADTMNFLQSYGSRAVGLVVDAQNNLNVLAKMRAGKLAGTGTANVVIPTNGTYVLKFNQAGTLTSAIKPDCSFTASGLLNTTTYSDIRLDRAPNGDFLMSGSISFTDFNNPVYDVSIDTHLYKTELLLARFDSQWQNLWMAGLDGGGIIAGRPSFDAAGNIYVGGTAGKGLRMFGDSIIGTGYSGSLPFVAKLNANGVKQWLSHATSTSPPPGTTGSCHAATQSFGAALRPDGTVFTVGMCGPLYWGNRKVVGVCNDGYRAFTARLDAYDGTVMQIDTFKHWPTANQSGLSVVNTKGGNIFVGGRMATRIYIGADTLTSNGGRSDMFLAKYGFNCNCALPNASYNHTVNTTTKTATFTYTGTTTGIDSIVWQFGNGQRQKVASGYTTPITHTYAGAGPYTATVVVFSQCGITAQSKSLQPTGITELGLLTGVEIYPNPTRDAVSITGTPVGTAYSLRTILGQEVSSGTISAATHTLLVDRLPTGTYFISFTAPDGRRATARVVRQ